MPNFIICFWYFKKDASFLPLDCHRTTNNSWLMDESLGWSPDWLQKISSYSVKNLIILLSISRSSIWPQTGSNETRRWLSSGCLTLLYGLGQHLLFSIWCEIFHSHCMILHANTDYVTVMGLIRSRFLMIFALSSLANEIVERLKVIWLFCFLH